MFHKARPVPYAAIHQLLRLGDRAAFVALLDRNTEGKHRVFFGYLCEELCFRIFDVREAVLGNLNGSALTTNGCTATGRSIGKCARGR
jgi:hypothetical protein